MKSKTPSVKKLTVKEKKAAEVVKKEITKEVEVKVEEIREKKIEEKKKKKEIELIKPKITLKVGDRVRMIDGKAIGTLDKIEKNKVVVNYGVFTSKVSIEQLEYVQP